MARDEYFHGMFQEMKRYLLDNGIRNVLVACPSCYQVFKKYGDELAVKTVYEVMVHNGLPDTGTSIRHRNNSGFLRVEVRRICTYR